MTDERWPDIMVVTADAVMVIPNPGPGKRIMVTLMQGTSALGWWTNNGRIENMGVVWHTISGCEITYRIEDMPKVGGDTVAKS